MEVQRSRCYFFSCEPVMSRGKKKETRAPYVQIQSPEAGLSLLDLRVCVQPSAALTVHNTVFAPSEMRSQSPRYYSSPCMALPV